MTTELPKVSKHAAIRYLERKVGYGKDEITKELISNARDELAEYFKQAVKKPIIVRGNLEELYRHEEYEIDFFVKNGTIVTCVPSSWREETKHKRPPKADNYKSKKINSRTKQSWKNYKNKPVEDYQDEDEN